MKYFTVICILVIFAVAGCYAAVAELSDSSLEATAASLAEKKTEKRGIFGFGYGHGLGHGYGHGFGYSHGGFGYPHYGGYASVHHGYAAPYYGGHGYYPHYSHGFYH